MNSYDKEQIREAYNWMLDKADDARFKATQWCNRAGEQPDDLTYDLYCKANSVEYAAKAETYDACAMILAVFI